MKQNATDQFFLRKLFKKRKFTLKVEGRSMLPMIRIGDILTLKKSSFGKTKENDIVLVVKKNRPLIHRVIYKGRKNLVTRGDNNLKSDGVIAPKNIIANVTNISRRNISFKPTDFYHVQSAYYFNELNNITEKFSTNKIKYLILKGLPLHLYYEKSIPQRLYSDCDFLIWEDDIERAEEILVREKFIKINEELSPAQKIFRVKPDEFSYYKNINNVSIVFDIHRKLLFLMNQFTNMDYFYPKKFENEINSEFKKSVKTVKIQGLRYPVLDSTHFVLYLALHLFHHNFKGMFRLKFMAHVINNRKDKINLSILKNTISKFKLEPMVNPAFMSVEKYYPSIPKSLLPEKNAQNSISIEPFDGDNRLEEGIKRLKLIFRISPEPLTKKLLFFLSPTVFLTAVWVYYIKIKFHILKLLNKSSED